MDAVPKYKDVPELKKHFLDGAIIVGRTLGIGAFGTVVEIQIAGTLYAGKTIHDALLNSQTQGTRYIIDKFIAECRVMSEVKHPNLIQFMGLCILDGGSHPTIVMEKLDMSLENILELQQDFPFYQKLAVLLDVSRGLIYLHGRLPPIIHRDLTSRNVLINRKSMQAKIADLGNALLTEPGALMKTLSQMPGTPVYMPPEAVGTNPQYDSSLDMFSFGQLSLYVAIGVFPGELLPTSYTDPVTEELKAYSEVERRRQYIDMLHVMVGEDNPLTKMVKGCLSNLTSKRPSADDAMKCITALQEVEGGQRSPEGNRLLEPPITTEPDVMTHLKLRVQQLKRGAAGVLRIYKSTGTVVKRLAWKQYVFKIVQGKNMPGLGDNSSVKYFRSDKEAKAVGEVKLANIIDVSIAESSEPNRFGFQIEFMGKANPESPWLLSTDTEEERLSWMEALQEGSALDLDYQVPQPLYEEIPNIIPQADLDTPLQEETPPLPPNHPNEDLYGLYLDIGDVAKTVTMATEAPEVPGIVPPQSTSLQPPMHPRADDFFTTPPPPPPVQNDTDPEEEVYADWEEYERLDLNQIDSSPYMDLQELQDGVYECPFDLQQEPAYNHLAPNPPEVTSKSHSPPPSRSSSAADLTSSLAQALTGTTPNETLAQLDPTQMQMFVLIQMQQMLQKMQESYQMVIPNPLAPPVSSFTHPVVTPSVVATGVGTPATPPAETTKPSDRCTPPPLPTKPKSFSHQPSDQESSRPVLYDDVLNSSDDDGDVHGKNREDLYQNVFTDDFTKALQDAARNSGVDLPPPDLPPKPKPRLRNPADKPSRPARPIDKDRATSFRSANERKSPLPPPRTGSLRLKVSSDQTERQEGVKPDQRSLAPQLPPMTDRPTSKEEKNARPPREGLSPEEEVGQFQPIPPPRFSRRSKRDAADMMKQVLGDLLDETKDMTSNAMLVTEEDEGDSYVVRPTWAKANTLPKPMAEDTLATLRQEALFIPRSSLQISQTIGQGQFGKIYKALLTKGSGPTMEVAVKTIKRYKSKKETSQFLQEMNIMSQLVHPNIIRLYGLVQQDSPWIVLELLPHGDLKKFLVKNPRPVHKLIKYMLDVSVGMHYLAEKGLVHRDLAARNVIVGENEICKVADFGLLRELPKDSSIYVATSNTPCPIRWMAPESFLQRVFSTASDVWSFGILQWELYNPAAEMPYEDFEDNQQCAAQVVAGHRLSIPEEYPYTVQRTMKSCWHQNPEKRPSFMLICTLLTNMAFRT